MHTFILKNNPYNKPGLWGCTVDATAVGWGEAQSMEMLLVHADC